MVWSLTTISSMASKLYFLVGWPFLTSRTMYWPSTFSLRIIGPEPTGFRLANALGCLTCDQMCSGIISIAVPANLRLLTAGVVKVISNDLSSIFLMPLKVASIAIWPGNLFFMIIS